MPRQDSSPQGENISHQYKMKASLFGPVRPSEDLNHLTQRVVKSHKSGRDYKSDILLRDDRDSTRVEFTITASCPALAKNAGEVYLNQLLDLVTSVTRSPVWFHMSNYDVRDERVRMNRGSAATIERFLTKEEWEWITGSLVYLRREHPRYLAAASWYRKGLLRRDILDDFYCFWKVIERLAESYADRQKNESQNRPIKERIHQLVSDLFQKNYRPDALVDQRILGKIVKLRNNLSHGNVPITPALIEEASQYLQPLEDAAYAVLQVLRQTKLVCTEPN